MKDFLKCKVCGKDFKNARGKHLHISKIHEISTSEYYEKYDVKLSLLHQKKIKYKNLNQYLNDDFVNREELIDWCLKEKPEIVEPYIKNLLINRKKEKNLNYSLSSIELELSNLPTIDIYKNLFGSYIELCQGIGFEVFLNQKMPEGFFDQQNELEKIFVDTREQKPIQFDNQESMKLDFGDYTCSSPNYDYTYIDRKSESDLKSTLSGDNFLRFKRELDRARSFNSFIFVVVESDINKIIENNIFSPHKSKLPYIWHNLKSLSQEYRDCCQFVFAGNRNGLKKLIYKILYYGKRLWGVDLQYFINKKIYERIK